jgi:2-C-methyl-D-erythritol 4-phosphate cytidylyltransferase
MTTTLRAVALVPAAGQGIRLAAPSGQKPAAPPKQLLELDGVPILFWTLRKLAACARIAGVIVSVRPADRAAVEKLLTGEDYGKRVTLVEGGESRQDSVANALARVPPATDLVLVHDAVRPFVELALVDRVLDAAAQTGAAILGLPATDTLKQVEPAAGNHAARILSTIPRERVVLAQTPQVFRFTLLRDALERAAADGFRGSDEAVLVERLGHPVTVVPGSVRNLKITTAADLDFARFLLAGEQGNRKGK